MPKISPHQSRRWMGILFLAAFFASSGYTVRPSSRQAGPVQLPKGSDDKVTVIGIFTGKILSQNGAQFILRDEANDTWYHLDDQQQAKKFLGKSVSVTGVLDQSTDTIRVRSIFEATA